MNTGTFYYPLFEHMSREHALTLVDSELAEIAHIAASLKEQPASEKKRTAASTATQFPVGLRGGNR